MASQVDVATHDADVREVVLRFPSNLPDWLGAAVGDDPRDDDIVAGNTIRRTRVSDLARSHGRGRFIAGGLWSHRDGDDLPRSGDAPSTRSELGATTAIHRELSADQIRQSQRSSTPILATTGIDGPVALSADRRRRLESASNRPSSSAGCRSGRASVLHNDGVFPVVCLSESAASATINVVV
jgi:hypothetical protein